MDTIENLTMRYKYVLERSKATSRTVMEQENIVPDDHPELEEYFDEYGYGIKTTAKTLAKMLDSGLGTDTFFSDVVANGRTVLHPGYVEMDLYKEGDTLLNFHNDKSLLTIHSKSNYPCLWIWSKGKKYELASGPEDAYFVQSGYTMDYLTGGTLCAGFHEVIFTEKAKQLYDERKKKGELTGRLNMSSFIEADLDFLMAPHPKFQNEKTLAKYPPKSNLELTLGYFGDNLLRHIDKNKIFRDSNH